MAAGATAEIVRTGDKRKMRRAASLSIALLLATLGTARGEDWLAAEGPWTPIRQSSWMESVQADRGVWPESEFLVRGQDGWGDDLWSFNTESGSFAMPLQLRLGKVHKIRRRSFNTAVTGFYTPDGLRKGPAPEWGMKYSVTLLIPGQVAAGAVCDQNERGRPAGTDARRDAAASRFLSSQTPPRRVAI